MSLVRAALTGTAIAVLAAAPVAAQAAAKPSLAQQLAQTASGFCIDILSRRVPVPVPGSPAYAAYGLSEGMPKAAMTALGTEGGALVSGATLAFGTASDGDFVVALGGRAGETCRLIVYRTVAAGAAERDLPPLMLGKALGWHSVPATAPSPAVRKQSLFKRDAAKLPYLANVIAPVAVNPVSLVVIIAAVPPFVTLPSGY